MARKKGCKTVPAERRRAIYDMSCVEVRHVDIARYYKIHKSSVSHIIRKFRTGHVATKRGRKQKLSERGMRLFHKYVLEYCFEPLYVIFSRFSEATGLKFHKNTGRRYVRKLNKHCYVAVQKPFLSKRNISKRILWARTHQSWTQKQWSHVMFTDESSFSVRPKKNRLHVRRQKEQKYRQNLTVPTYKSGYQTVPVWGGFSSGGRTPLVRTVGSFDQHTYRVMIDNHILPFVYDVHGGTNTFILQEDNCGPHRAKSIATYLANEDITRMEWAPQSPDLNPIENCGAG